MAHQTGHVEATMIIFTEALEAIFGGTNHPDEQMRNLSVHTEYPVDKASYPGFWVQYTPQGDVQNAGIGHYELVAATDNPDNFRKAYRWKFKGVVEIVIATLGNLERARMVDAVIETIAVGVAGDGAPESVIREHVQNSDIVGLAVDWESFNVGGFAENPGTPWGTEEVIYEGTITLALEGEFAFDAASREMVPLARIDTYARTPDQPDRDPDGTQGSWR